MPNTTLNRSILYPTRIDLPLEAREVAIALLSTTLATTLDLQTQSKQAHWNVKGLDFLQLHELFDQTSTELIGFIDLMAERITALGGVAVGTARVAAAQSLIEEYPLEASSGPEHLTALADRMAVYARHVREGIGASATAGDEDTADLYTEISRAVDKRLWLLEAHLQ